MSRRGSWSQGPEPYFKCSTVFDVKLRCLVSRKSPWYLDVKQTQMSWPQSYLGLRRNMRYNHIFPYRIFLCNSNEKTLKRIPAYNLLLIFLKHPACKKIIYFLEPKPPHLKLVVEYWSYLNISWSSARKLVTSVWKHVFIVCVRLKEDSLL